MSYQIHVYKKGLHLALAIWYLHTRKTSSSFLLKYELYLMIESESMVKVKVTTVNANVFCKSNKY